MAIQHLIEERTAKNLMLAMSYGGLDSFKDGLSASRG
jgi:hypothetical protein